MCKFDSQPTEDEAMSHNAQSLRVLIYAVFLITFLVLSSCLREDDSKSQARNEVKETVRQLSIAMQIYYSDYGSLRSVAYPGDPAFDEYVLYPPSNSGFMYTIEPLTQHTFTVHVTGSSLKLLTDDPELVFTGTVVD
jgi:hypothetical protein